jgi:ubiquinone/menaquinone biosynthesis C-methylase UbiE
MTKSIIDVKDFWNKRPCNLKHSNKSIGALEYFKEVEFRKYYVERHIVKFANFPKWTTGKKVLEIGCGLGTDTINFARSGADVVAIELSEKSIELAKIRAKLYHVENKIDFIVGNVEELSSFLPVQTFDLVYSFGVLHHTPNPEKAIIEIEKYMNKDSTLKIMLYNKLSWKVFWILIKYGKGAFWKLDKLISEYSEAQNGCPVTYTYTKKSVEKLLENFDIKSIKIEHIFPYKISDYVNYKYTKEWYFRYIPENIFRWLEHKIGWHLCITAKLRD